MIKVFCFSDDFLAVCWRCRPTSFHFLLCARWRCLADFFLSHYNRVLQLLSIRGAHDSMQMKRNKEDKAWWICYCYKLQVTLGMGADLQSAKWGLFDVVLLDVITWRSEWVIVIACQQNNLAIFHSKTVILLDSLGSRLDRYLSM